MQTRLYLDRLRIRNLLSFGNEGVDIPLTPLNVLIGPNTSGKSNLVEIIGLLHSTSTNMATYIAQSGGLWSWVWKGAGPVVNPKIEVVIGHVPTASYLLRYQLSISAFGSASAFGLTPFAITEECLHRIDHRYDDDSQSEILYEFTKGKAFIRPDWRAEVLEKGTESKINTEPVEIKEIDISQSVFSQIKDIGRYLDLSMTGRHFKNIALYSDWPIGIQSPMRRSQGTDMSGDVLSPDGSNLAIVLNNLQGRPEYWSRLIDRAREFYPDLEGIHLNIRLGYVDLQVHQKGLEHPIPAIRLSDGTLRFLCLLTILCHPEPPPLVCIEEPELGLHPDMLPKVAEMLVEASERTQLIVTTHSDILVSALSDYPEYIIVCERDEDGTHLKRLEPEPLKKWLKDYSLGDLWLDGEIGGTRW